MFKKLSFVLIALLTSCTLSAMQEQYENLELKYKNACELYDKRQIKEAYNIFLDAAECGHAKSLNSLGSINESEGDLVTALEFYKFSCEREYTIGKENYYRLLKLISHKNPFLEAEAKKDLEHISNNVSSLPVESAESLYINGYYFSIRHAITNLYNNFLQKEQIEKQMLQMYPNDLIYIKSVVNELKTQ